MPSFDAVLEPDMVAIKNSVANAQKEIGTRFDFKGTAAALELKEKDKQIELLGDSDFQIEQVSQVLVGKLTKIKAGIEADLAKKLTGAIKNSKLKVAASVQGDEVRVTGKNRDDLQQAIALLKKDFADQPLKFQNFRD